LAACFAFLLLQTYAVTCDVLRRHIFGSVRFLQWNPEKLLILLLMKPVHPKAGITKRKLYFALKSKCIEQKRDFDINE